MQRGSGHRGRRRLVVVGGDAAGMSAASQARRLLGPEQLEILVFEQGNFTSYSACGIPYWIAGLVDERDRLIARWPSEFQERQSIDVRIRHEVIEIDAHGRTVVVRDLATGGAHTHAYDDLLVATGAVPTSPPVPGIDADGVLGVQTLDDGQRVLDALEQRRPQRAVVIGAGYIGLEMAEAMCARGLEVHLVEADPRPMTAIDDELGDRIAAAMRRTGFLLHLGDPVEAVEVGDDGWVRAVTTKELSLACDIVVLGAGVRPNTELAAAAGLPIGPSGGIVADARQCTPFEGVWTAGDCAETFHRVSRAPVAIPLGTIANKQGRVAGLNLGGDYGRFPGVLGTSVTKVCGLEIARTGLGEQEAIDAGFLPVAATITSTTRAGYHPDAAEVTIKLLAEHGSGRMLGAQIVGEEGAAKRIDVLATALWNDMLVEDLIDVDLGYAPPFSPVWDPVLIAARQAAKAVDGARRG